MKRVLTKAFTLLFLLLSTPRQVAPPPPMLHPIPRATPAAMVRQGYE